MKTNQTHLPAHYTRGPLRPRDPVFCGGFFFAEMTEMKGRDSDEGDGKRQEPDR